MKIEVLNQGYVKLVEAYGTGEAGFGDERAPLYLEKPDYECGIVEAARQSTQGAFRGWDQDERLLKYLHDHRHQTPFEFAGMIVEVRAPIFVFREWHRHRTQSYNEMSARYTPLPDFYYVPTVERLLVPTEGPNKQASRQDGSHPLTLSTAQDAQDLIRRTYDLTEHHYQSMLTAGVPKELARLVMPVGHYTQMRANANLRNWLGFLTLRLDSAAQWEIRQYASAVGQLIAATFPRTWALFCAERERALTMAQLVAIAEAAAALDICTRVDGDVSDLCELEDELTAALAPWRAANAQFTSTVEGQHMEKLPPSAGPKL